MAGIAIIFAFSAQETHTENVTVKDWPLQQRTLEPQDTAGPYGYGPIEREMWFQLQISSSNSEGAPAPVKVTVSSLQQSGTGPVGLPIYQETESNFNLQVIINSTGTYSVLITNVNTFSVTLQGNILVQKNETTSSTNRPFATQGFIIILGGISVLIFGVFKGSKTPLKPKEKRKRIRR